MSPPFELFRVCPFSNHFLTYLHSIRLSIHPVPVCPPPKLDPELGSLLTIYDSILRTVFLYSSTPSFFLSSSLLYPFRAVCAFFSLSSLFRFSLYLLIFSISFSFFRTNERLNGLMNDLHTPHLSTLHTPDITLSSPLYPSCICSESLFSSSALSSNSRPLFHLPLQSRVSRTAAPPRW